MGYDSNDLPSGPLIHGGLLYSTPSSYSWLLSLLIAIVLLFNLGLGVYFLIIGELLGGGIVFAALAFVIVLYLVILPRRIDIYTERLTVVSLGGVPYSTQLCNIISATKHDGIWISYPCSTLKFATDFEDVVVIQRRNSWLQYLTISPADPATFLSQLAAAMRPGMYSAAPASAPAPFMFPNGAADYNRV